MKFSVLTIFPEMITDYSSQSILKRGQAADVITVSAVNIREFSADTRGTVDDTP